MRRQQLGFTLIELMIVITIIGLLAAVLLPNIISSQTSANIQADSLNQRRQFEWMLLYKQKHNGMFPPAGGHQFVLSTWTSKIFDHTPENLDRYFTPGSNDPHWQEQRKKMMAGEDPWPNLQAVTTMDTHYVGRAKDQLRSLTGETEAMLANDNEGAWAFPDGSLNILLSSGNVRPLSYPQMRELYGLPDFDRNKEPLKTWGTDSPIPECRKLDN